MIFSGSIWPWIGAAMLLGQSHVALNPYSDWLPDLGTKSIECRYDLKGEGFILLDVILVDTIMD